MRRAEWGQGDIQLAIGDADVACGGKQLMQQGSPLLIDTGVVRPIQLGATADEPPLIDATAMALAVGQHIEAVPDHRREQLRAPAAAVEDNGDLSFADNVP